MAKEGDLFIFIRFNLVKNFDTFTISVSDYFLAYSLYIFKRCIVGDIKLQLKYSL